jgi:hypothetical protein
MEPQQMEQIIRMLAIIEARMDANHEKMMAFMANVKYSREETMACQETMEARLGKEEPASEDLTPEVAHEQEVPKEDTVILPVGEPRKMRRDRYLAAVRRQKKQQKRTQRKNGCRKDLVAAGRGTTRRAAVAPRRNILLTEETSRESRGSRKRLVAAREGTTRCAGMARRKENLVRKSRIRNDVVGGALRERTTEKRRRMNPEGNTEIKDPGARRQLRLRNDRTAGRICGKTNEKVIGLETAKQIAGFPVPLQKNKDWTLWRGRPLRNQKRCRKQRRSR